MEAQRLTQNPLIAPVPQDDWQAEAAFNGCPALGDEGIIHFVYRAVSSTRNHEGHDLQLSTIGYGRSIDGISVTDRRQLIKPEYDWERFGCEDPRITKCGDMYYIFYTALSTYPFTPEGIKVAVAVTKDFINIEKHLVTPFNAKAMVLFPEKIKGKFAVLLTVHTDKPPATICLAFFDTPKDMWSRSYWEKWYQNRDQHILPLRRDMRDHVEVGTPPVRTTDGWLFSYAYIKNYFSPPTVFGIEAVVLNLTNPLCIMGRTRDPLLIPEERYERFGKVPNVIFPSGLLIRNKKAYLYYGAADTTCAAATVPLAGLLRTIRLSHEPPMLRRAVLRPIIEPNPNHAWEARATFNTAAFIAKNQAHLVYRALSNDSTSVMGYAASRNGITLTQRLAEPIYVPREEFEQKRVAGGNSGCEDPRITKIGQRLYMCYTAYDGINLPRVALSSITVNDFLAKRWKKWSRPILISPPGIDDKDAALFPKKIKGKYAILHRIGSSIWLDFVDTLDLGEGAWLGGKVLMSPRSGDHDSRKIGIAAPPIETEYGWLLIYHGISKRQDHHYHLRAALLELANPLKIIARTKDPIFEPEMPYEKIGEVPHVVFSCGAVVMGDCLIVYYGGADKVIGVAEAKLSEFIKGLLAEKGGS